MHQKFLSAFVHGWCERKLSQVSLLRQESPSCQFWQVCLSPAFVCVIVLVLDREKKSKVLERANCVCRVLLQ